MKYAKENAKNENVNVKFMLLDISRLNQIKERFDFVFEWTVMHHVPFNKRDDYVKSVANLLNHNGKYLSYSFHRNNKCGGKGSVRKTSMGFTLYLSTQKELEKLFKPYFKVLSKNVIKTRAKNFDYHLGNLFFLEKL